MSTKTRSKTSAGVDRLERSAARSALKIYIDDVSGFAPVPSAQRIRSWLGRAFAGQLDGELSIRIVGEAEGRALNRRYRGRDVATNVLSFDGAETPDGGDGGAPRLLGDLVICAPVVAREAAEQGKTLDAHWAHLALHGVLHLLGYDHEGDEDAHEMQERELELLALLGFVDPSAPPR